MRDQPGPYFRALEELDRPRTFLRGADPENAKKLWLFEVVEDEGERVALKQIEIDASEAIHRYWCEHLEDEHGFLTDQPLDGIEELSEISREQFERIWNS